LDDSVERASLARPW